MLQDVTHKHQSIFGVLVILQNPMKTIKSAREFMEREIINISYELHALKNI